ncbi:MAG: hypothetical protein ACTSW1_17620 [Candidatus Hodarchaeales archaeon]
MIVNSSKFPFKWFGSIIGLLAKRNGLPTPVYDVARGIGSCVPDGIETCHMLEYLLCFGKLSLYNSSGWELSFKKEKKDFPAVTFRSNFIQSLIELLEVIYNSKNPLTTEEIAKVTNNKSQDVEEALKFYRNLSKNGKICRKGDGYMMEWYLKDWSQ